MSQFVEVIVEVQFTTTYKTEKKERIQYMKTEKTQIHLKLEQIPTTHIHLSI
jgi:hypothetical protein